MHCCQVPSALKGPTARWALCKEGQPTPWEKGALACPGTAPCSVGTHRGPVLASWQRASEGPLNGGPVALHMASVGPPKHDTKHTTQQQLFALQGLPAGGRRGWVGVCGHRPQSDTQAPRRRGPGQRDTRGSQTALIGLRHHRFSGLKAWGALPPLRRTCRIGNSQMCKEGAGRRVGRWAQVGLSPTP